MVKVLASICGMSVVAGVCADADEASVVRATLPVGTRPLLALILDTSDTAPLTTREPFDPARIYGDDVPVSERCYNSRIYWRRGAGHLPDCGRQAGLEAFPPDSQRGLQCETARASLETVGFHVAGRAAQWRAAAVGGDWTLLREDSTAAVECLADANVALAWDRSPFADPYIFYTGNYLNWLRTTAPPVEKSRVEHLADSLSAALRATGDLDVAWIRVAHDGRDGGHVAGAPMPAAQAADLLAGIAAEPPGTGGVPLAEALVESALWLAGGIARFGVTDAADVRVFDNDDPGRYQSPFGHACRPVTLAFVTPGLADGDDLAGNAAAALPGFVAETGGCGADCLATVARWITTGDLRGDLPGVQSAAMRFLDDERLEDPAAVIDLVARSLQRDAAVPAPPQLSAPALIASPVSASTSDIVFSLSAPRVSARWNGNLYRYALRAADSPVLPPDIVDRDGEPAIGTDALPLPSSRSLWSDAPDADLLAGGAAGRLPAPARRELYAELGDARITAATNLLSAGNPRIHPSMLGLNPNDTESAGEVLDWLANDRRLGDYGPHAPAVASYPESRLQVVYAANQDGMLQAFDADSGIELWGWMPAPLMPRLAQLMRDEETAVRDHGIDGALVLHRHDPDGDGRIDTSSGEHLWLLFGLGRGGNRYYALDVADADAPRLLWSFALPGDAALESRADPVVTRIALDGADQNADRWVVLLAGGYDRRFDAQNPPATDPASALHLIDAESGALLWTAGGASDAPLPLPGFDASFASAPRALDLDGDAQFDRAYAIDVAGGLWRFDFASGRPPADLAQARRVAQLGTGPQRFHGTPDVSLVRFVGGARLAVSVGSGWLARPLDESIVDRVYTVFDAIDATAMENITDADLYDAGNASDAMPVSAPGWFRRLDHHGSGEKTIGSSLTFDGVLHLQTWQPLPADPVAPCGPPRGARRRYAFDIRDGRSHAVSRDAPAEETIDIPGSGLPVALRFGFPGDAGVGCDGCRPRAFGIAGAATFDTDYAADPARTSWRKLAPPPASR